MCKIIAYKQHTFYYNLTYSLPEVKSVWTKYYDSSVLK